MQIREGHHRPAEPVSSDGGGKLDVHVVFTNAQDTQATLKSASGLARDLGARLTILVAQIVPYPLPLGNPPVPVEFTEQAIQSIARDQEVETTIKICLCRDRRQAIRQMLRPDSVVVIGGRKRWWPGAGQSLARMLTRDGHQVMMVDPHKLPPVEAALEKVDS